tara:strand:+ start:2673 stop:3791 length:1119 start_codon:yes stop_codon:yes gene_type:complete
MEDKPDHSNRGHAEFSPSSLKYVAGCSGFVGRSGTNAAAEKGTRIHEALEIKDPSALHDEEEVNIYEAIVADEEAYLNSFANGASYKEYNEIQVDIKLDGTETWGTCDKFVKLGDKAVMIDYKTGISQIDEPRENWQAMAYTVGAFQAHEEVNEIDFVFFIPVRAQTLTGIFTRDELPELIKKLSKIIKRGEKIRPQWDDGAPDLYELNPTVNCRFCAHEDVCPALGGLAVEVASRVADDALPRGDISDPDDPKTVEHLYVVSKIVTNWATRIKAKAMAMAKEGVEFPTLRLKSMGAPKKCTNNIKLAKLAEEFDLEPEQVLDIASVPLTKLAKAIGDTAPDGEKKQKSKEFLDAAQDLDIIATSDERFTLS